MSTDSEVEMYVQWQNGIPGHKWARAQREHKIARARYLSWLSSFGSFKYQ